MKKNLHLSLTAEEAAYVEADAVQLGEVVDNLLDNAIKYTPEGESIQVTLEETEDAVHLRVRDTGAGFSPEEADHLFDRFYRSDVSAIQNESGSGLVLATDRLAFAMSHQGWVESLMTVCI